MSANSAGGISHPDPVQEGCTGSGAARWAWLGRCMSNPGHFIAEDWSARPSLDLGTPSRFTDLFSITELDNILAMGAIESAKIRIIKDSVPMPRTAFVPARRNGHNGDATIDCGRVGELVRMGGTLAVTEVDKAATQLFELCSGLEHELSHHVSANAYLTPPQSQGFGTHRDGHDTMILQISGSKEWLVYDYQPGLGARAENVTIEPAQEAVVHSVLEEGNALYIPRGWPHMAKTAGTVSLHVTLAIVQATTNDLMRYALELPAIRRLLDNTMPAGFTDDPAAVADALAEGYELVARALADPSIKSAVLEGFVRSWRQGRARGQEGRLVRATL
jgi:bifunctional lysine-specific demethylase and histidyl-hydroxylase NO66